MNAVFLSFCCRVCFYLWNLFWYEGIIYRPWWFVQSQWLLAIGYSHSSHRLPCFLVNAWSQKYECFIAFCLLQALFSSAKVRRYHVSVLMVCSILWILALEIFKSPLFQPNSARGDQKYYIYVVCIFQIDSKISKQSSSSLLMSS